MYTDPTGHKVKWNQWNNLIGSFIKEGIEININNSPLNPIASWNRMTGLIDTIGLIANGDIGLIELVKSMGENMNWILDHWYIISDKNKYDNGWINEFGSHLAGAYFELARLGGTVAGIAQFSNSLSDIGGMSNTGIEFESFNDLKKYLGSPGEGNQWHHIVEQSQIGKSGFSVSKIQNTSNIIAVDKTTHAQISGYYSSKQAFTGGMTVRDWLAGQSFEAQYKFGINVLKNYGVIQ
jgi:hypothetical protein